MNIRERLESMLRPNKNGLLPCLWCACPDADELAIEIVLTGFESLTSPSRWRRVACSCGAAGPSKNGRYAAIAAWNSRPFLRALLLAIDAVPCDQDLHARHRESECDRCVLEIKVAAILEGREP